MPDPTEETLATPVMRAGTRRTRHGLPLTSGVNVDRVNIAAGAAEAAAIGYLSEEDQMVVIYALQRHARGEEDGAQRTALGHGIDLTGWYRILAAAVSRPPAATHTCDTGHFDRDLCADPCATMHSYCSRCGTPAEPCPHNAL